MRSKGSLTVDKAARYKRDPAIELYRISLMFGICLLHAVGFGDYSNRFAVNALTFCVVGFVFISGWYGVRFSWMKLAKLYGIGLYCAFAVTLLHYKGFDVCAIRDAVHLLTHGFWFLHAYALMMVFAPLVNMAMPPVSPKMQLWASLASISPLFFLVWFWGFGRTLPVVGEWFPKTDGLEAYGGITLLGIYAGARLIRLSDIAEKIKGWHLIVAIPTFLVLCAIGLGDYNSPFAFGLAASLFFCFQRLNGQWLDGLLGRFVCFLGPGMFSVYLIHCNPLGVSLIQHVERCLHNFGCIPQSMVVVITATCLFGSAFFLDIPRRLFIALMAIRKGPL